jgi:hypothetical protein
MQWPGRRLCDRARRMVRGAGKVGLQPAKLVVRAGMERPAAGWRTFGRERSGRPMRLWWAQLGLNFLWSPVFFFNPPDRRCPSYHSVLAVLVAFIAISWQRDPAAAWLFVRAGCFLPRRSMQPFGI